jgi:hypothetical protein
MQICLGGNWESKLRFYFNFAVAKENYFNIKHSALSKRGVKCLQERNTDVI